MTKREISQSELKALISYNPITGQFIWRERDNRRGGWNGTFTGKPAGCINEKGYLIVVVKSRPYKGHRLAWLYVHGVWPRGVIDHINGNRLDNRIENLRDVTTVVNMQNQRRANANTKSGLLGVKWRSDRSRWVSEIYINGKPKRIGSFTDKYEAHEAYLVAKRKYHEGCTI